MWKKFGQLLRWKLGNSSDNIIPDPLSSKNPTAVWENIRSQQKYSELDPPNPKALISNDKIRFVCISDTHSRIEDLPLEFIPDSDMILHAGDITNLGEIEQIVRFNEYLGKLPHKHKIVIAGNHDITFDLEMIKNDPEAVECMFGVVEKECQQDLNDMGVNSPKELFTNCTYLQDSSVQLYGINIYGSPWQPVFGGWAFNVARGEKILKKWNKIPTGTDILITHGPPLGYGDEVGFGQRAGCVELLSTIQKRVKPQYHVFGHIHEGYGMYTDETTTFINASTVTVEYEPVNPPIVFDFPLPPGYRKE